MKLTIQICSALVIILAVTAVNSENKFPGTAISDDVINQALSDDRYLMRQIKCALGQGTCDPVGKRIRSMAPFAIRGSCPRCSPQEIKQIQKVLSHIQQKYPKEWSKLIHRYA